MNTNCTVFALRDNFFCIESALFNRPRLYELSSVCVTRFPFALLHVLLRVKAWLQFLIRFRLELTFKLYSNFSAL